MQLLTPPTAGNLLDEDAVLNWMMKQKTDESIEDIDRETLFEYIEYKEFLAVVFCKFHIRIKTMYYRFFDFFCLLILFI